MPEPSLSELSNMPVDAALAQNGAPAVAIGPSSAIISNLNQSLQERNRLQHEKYKEFMGRLEKAYERLGETGEYNVLPQDQPELQKRRDQLFYKIGENPGAFFGVGNQAMRMQLEKEMATLKSDAIASQNNSLYDAAHRKMIETHPEFDTPENRKMIEGYSGAKLGARKEYTLALPSAFDPKVLGESLAKSVVDTKSIRNLSEDGLLITPGTKTELNQEKFDQLSKAMYNMPANGRPLSSTIRSNFEALAPEIKAQFTGEDPALEYFKSTLLPYIPAGQTKWEKPEQNRAYLQTQKYINDLTLLKQKNDYALIQEGAKAADAQELARLKSKLSGKSAAQDVPRNMVTDLIAQAGVNALGDKSDEYSRTDENGNKFYKLDAGDVYLQKMGKTEGSSLDKTIIAPDEVWVSAENNDVIKTVRYNRHKGKIDYNSIDKDNSKTISRDEFTGVVSKTIFGASGAYKFMGNETYKLKGPDGKVHKKSWYIKHGYTEDQLAKYKAANVLVPLPDDEDEEGDDEDQ